MFQSFIWIKDLKRGESCPRLPLNLADRLHRQSFAAEHDNHAVAGNNRCSKFDNFPEGAVAPLVCTRYYHNQVRPRSGNTSNTVSEKQIQASGKSRKRPASNKSNTMHSFCIKAKKTRPNTDDSEFLFPLYDMLSVGDDKEQSETLFDTHFDKHVACCVHQMMDAMVGDQICAPHVYSSKPDSSFKIVTRSEMVSDVLPLFKRFFIDDAPRGEERDASQTNTFQQTSLPSEQQCAVVMEPNTLCAEANLEGKKDRIDADVHQIASSKIRSAYESTKQEIRLVAKQYAQLIFEKCMFEIDAIDKSSTLPDSYKA
ncbi:hypothetical protein CYMTET_55139 [Cymbomonas tetramitiformis]|uniref:Uncharacterized protein n=1 Tax=Cymbomonas tetramitiformis TaxID=36881 RepID=A0AAE0BEN6_9CHLO|nr:hypothetical protein CYMTET_55139 [Cymbomonas tetramitiformis]